MFNFLESKSPIKRIYTIVFSAFLIQTSYFLVQYYNSTVTEAQNVTRERLNGVANSIALQINGDEHDKLMSKYRDKDAIVDKVADSIYNKIHLLLNHNFKSNGLSSAIYTLVLDSTGKSFEFGVTSSEQPYFRHSYAHFPNVLIQQMKTGGTLSLYKDEFGSWISAFTPLHNSKGEVVALLMVDEKFDKILEYITDANRKNLYVSLIIFFVLAFGMRYFIKKIVRKENENLNALKKAFLEKRKFSEKLHESETKLKEYALRLEKSNKELTDFAHIASHDLKAPVRGIMMFAQLFEKRNKGKMDERDTEYINYIKNNANQSLMLIEGLLNYSKIDKNLGEPIEVNVCHSIEVAVSNLQSFIEEKKGVVIYKDLPTIKAHPLLISQLFQNLISNALKYNESKCPEVTIKFTQSDDGQCVFSVTDNGIGIAENFQKSVFEMFHRLHSAAVYEGSGIGLAFCNRIVATYNGRMWLESELGKGSTFYFTLPSAIVAESTESFNILEKLKLLNKAA